MKRYLCILFFLLAAAAFGPCAHAQFKEEAFSQNYNDDPDSPKDSTDVMFSFKEFFGGIAHKNTGQCRFRLGHNAWYRADLQ